MMRMRFGGGAGPVAAVMGQQIDATGAALPVAGPQFGTSRRGTSETPQVSFRI